MLFYGRPQHPTTGARPDIATFLILILLIFLGPNSSQADLLLPQLILESEDSIEQLKVVDGSLWILGGRQLFRLTDSDDTPQVVLDKTRATAIVSFKGSTFVGTTEGLLRLGSSEPELSGPPITSLAVFEDFLWIGSPWGLFVLGKDKPIHPLSVLDLKMVGSNLWIASSQGASWIEGSENTEGDSALVRPLKAVTFDRSFVAVRTIQTVGEQIWLSTISDSRFDRPERPYLVSDGIARTPDGAEDWKVSSIIDFQASPVFATRKGLGRFVSSEAELIPTNRPVRIVFEHNSDLFLGTTDGLLRGSLESTFEKSDVGGDLIVTDTAVFQSNLWIAAEQGLFSWVADANLEAQVQGLGLQFQRSLSFDVGYSGTQTSSSIEEDDHLYSVCDANIKGEADQLSATEEDGDCNPPELDLWRNLGSFFVEDQYGNRSRDFRFKVWVLPDVEISLILLVFLVGTPVFFLRRRKAHQVELQETQNALEEAHQAELQEAQDALEDLQSQLADAEIDQLTSLLTRSSGEKIVEKALMNAAKSRHKPSLLLLDIDHFKSVNDEHGHNGGDDVLKQLGSMISKRYRRNSDHAVRWGGEEFLILSMERAKGRALEYAEGLRKDVEETPISIEGKHGQQEIDITISAGITHVFHPDESFKEIIARVDSALYQSKNSGRNQVTVTD